MKRLRNLIVAATASCAVAGSAGAQEVKVGVVLSNTGTFAFVGAPVINAIRLAHEEMVAASFFGATKVTLMVEDNRSDKQEALTLINRMATRDNAVMIIGPVSTGEAMAAAPLAVDLKIPLFTTATAPDVLKAGPWIFKSTETAEQFMTPLGKHVAETVKPKSCTYVFIRDNEGYVRQKDILRDVMKAGGVAVAGEESILAADSDFTALATKIVAAKPDCLYLGTPPEQGANIVIQARQAGMPAKTVLVGNTGMGSARYLNAGGKLVEGTLLPAEFVPTGVNELGRKFIENYTQEIRQCARLLGRGRLFDDADRRQCHQECRPQSHARGGARRHGKDEEPAGRHRARRLLARRQSDPDVRRGGPADQGREVGQAIAEGRRAEIAGAAPQRGRRARVFRRSHARAAQYAPAFALRAPYALIGRAP